MFIQNGKTVSEEVLCIRNQNRAFKYGDGFFETIRCYNGQPLHWDLHHQRILSSCHLLEIESESVQDKTILSKKIFDLHCANNIGQHSRVRITFYRNGGGYYLPASNGLDYLIEISELTSGYNHEITNISLGLFQEIKKPINRLSQLKSCNALLYVLAAKYSSNIGMDDCIIFNTENNVCEAISSNIIVVKNGEIFCPDKNQGAVLGIMQKVLEDILISNNLKLTGTSIKLEDLLYADEVWLANAINGIRNVGFCNNKTFGNQIFSKIARILKNTYTPNL